MKKQKDLINKIKEFSYTDFVGYINQWNVLPGSYSTLSKWKIFSDINKDSNILEVACTTGFSLRELAKMTKCSGVGIDISEKSIISAKYNKDTYAPNTRINYLHQDAYSFEPKQKFSHIMVGAALQFFPDPKKMLNLCVNWIENPGYILASPFYVNKEIPSNLVKRFEKIFNISPTQISYKEVMSLYQPLEIIFEERNDILPETNEELSYYCNSTVDRFMESNNFTNSDLRDIVYNRLYEIKEMSNLLRPYQGYSVLVLRYEKEVYPNRFVELF